MQASTNIVQCVKHVLLASALLHFVEHFVVIMSVI